MKKAILLLFIFLSSATVMMGQQAMTDEQVMNTILKEHAAGKSQAQIVTRLVQSGVNIQQIRRIKKRFEQQGKAKGFGMMSDKTKPASDNRMRRSEEHTSELQSRQYLVCRLLLEKKNNK